MSIKSPSGYNASKKALFMLAYILITLCTFASSAPTGQLQGVETPAPLHVSFYGAFKDLLENDISDRQLLDGSEAFWLSYTSDVRSLCNRLAEYTRGGSLQNMAERVLSGPLMSVMYDLHFGSERYLMMRLRTIPVVRHLEEWHILGSIGSEAVDLYALINAYELNFRSMLKSTAEYDDIVSLIQTLHRQLVAFVIHDISLDLECILCSGFSDSKMNSLAGGKQIGQLASLADLMKKAEQKKTIWETSPESFMAVDAIDGKSRGLVELLSLSSEITSALKNLSFMPEQDPPGLPESPTVTFHELVNLEDQIKRWHHRPEDAIKLREISALQKKLAQLLHEITMAKYSSHQLGMRLSEFDDQGSSELDSDPGEPDTAAALIQQGKEKLKMDYNSAGLDEPLHDIAEEMQGLCTDLEICKGALEERSEQSNEIVGQLQELCRSISTATMNQHTGKIVIDRQRSETAGPLSSNLNVREATLEDLTNLLENAKSCQELLKNPARIREETAASQKEILELLSEIKMASEAKQQKPAVAHAAVKLREEMVGKWGTDKHYADRSQDIVSVSRQWRESYDDLDRLRRLLSVLREGEAECCFCAQPMHIEATTLPCDHKCHPTCLEQWTSQKIEEDRAATCPLCRREIEHLEPA